MTANRIDRILIALIAAITAIGAVVWDIYTPYTVDDYFYREIIRADFSPTTETWPGGNEDITTLPQAWKSIKNHTVYNGRLANFLHILMQPAGRTAESVLLGLCIGALFLLLCKCIRSFSGPLTAGHNRRHPVVLDNITVARHFSVNGLPVQLCAAVAGNARHDIAVQPCLGLNVMEETCTLHSRPALPLASRRLRLHCHSILCGSSSDTLTPTAA